MSTRYKVLITPLVGVRTYGSVIDVSDFVVSDGIAVITNNIDSVDYDFGVFTYGDITINAFNQNGYFNDRNDSRSIFTFGRDLAKVTVEYSNADGDTITFKGLVNEEATRLDPITEQIKFKVLSLDSVIRNTQVSFQAVSNGESCRSALITILGNSVITSVLHLDPANINPTYNFTIDDGSQFDNTSTRDSLNNLLLASNSIFLIDDNDNMIVQSRVQNTVPILNLFGPYDIHRRENISGLTQYNSGIHRMFTSVKVNDSEVSDNAFVQTFGYRQKAITLNFITSSITATAIATALVSEFKAPKFEFIVDVPTSVGKGIALLDPISVNFPLRLKPYPGSFFPVIGTTKLGSTSEKLPQIFGSVMIPANYAFKVIQISEDPKQFKMSLKLRQTGTSLSDGLFNGVGNDILGFAVLGEAIMVHGPDDTWNPSVLGAALLGSTDLAA